MFFHFIFVLFFGFASDDNPIREIDYSVEIVNMYSWLLNRIDYLDPIINNY